MDRLHPGEGRAYGPHLCQGGKSSATGKLYRERERGRIRIYIFSIMQKELLGMRVVVVDFSHFPRISAFISKTEKATK